MTEDEMVEWRHRLSGHETDTYTRVCVCVCVCVFVCARTDPP